MKTVLLDSFAELERQLQSDILSSEGTIAVLAGHFPVVLDETGTIVSDIDHSFGVFPRFSFALGCRLVSFAKQHGKNAKLVLVVDDHSLLPNENWFLDADAGSKEVGVAVGRFFDAFEIPPGFQTILEQNGLSENDFARTSDKKIFFQESAFRLDFFHKTGLKPGCAGEVKLIWEDLARQGIRHFIGFIPERCKSPTCTAVNFYGREKDNPALKLGLVFLSSDAWNRSQSDLLEQMKKQLGGVPLIRWH